MPLQCPLQWGFRLVGLAPAEVETPRKPLGRRRRRRRKRLFLPHIPRSPAAQCLKTGQRSGAELLDSAMDWRSWISQIALWHLEFVFTVNSSSVFLLLL